MSPPNNALQPMPLRVTAELGCYASPQLPARDRRERYGVILEPARCRIAIARLALRFLALRTVGLAGPSAIIPAEHLHPVGNNLRAVSRNAVLFVLVRGQPA